MRKKSSIILILFAACLQFAWQAGEPKKNIAAVPLRKWVLSQLQALKTDLKKIINEVTEDLKEEIQKQNAHIEIGKLCQAQVIPFQFRQLIHNLLSNSLKFVKTGTTPYIKIEDEIAKGATLNKGLDPQINYCHLRVSDNGIGFEPQYKDKIFEVFQRLHGKDKYPGTGVGLAIVKKIVENHNGLITATAEPGKGASFDIYFPAEATDAPETMSVTS